jgi:hypothetical protein
MSGANRPEIAARSTWPRAEVQVRMVTPATAPCAPSSARAMCARDSQSTSWPGATSDRTASRFASDPVGVKSAASCPNRRGHPLLQGEDGRVLAVHVVADLGRGHGRAHPVGRRVMVSLRRSIGTKSIRPRGRRCPSVGRDLDREGVVAGDDRAPVHPPVVAVRRGGLPRVPALPEVSEWLPRLSTDEAAVVERFADEDFRRRTLVIEADGQVVGDLYLAISDAWAQAEVQDRTVDAQAEIGWALSPTHQGRGLAFEAVHRLVASASTTWASTGCTPPASPTTPRPGT